ncbi:MAG: hypothetical protein PHF86_08155 [Candidatus Nanoarchaeia archaeon]|nr:hypothetical protein [Candidatus Nanoarchaeia archaeon]
MFKRKINSNDIVISLKSYNDIFSSLDPRPFINRSTSHDLLSELKRATKDKDYNGINLKFTIPKSKRKANIEKIIRLRLKDHFEKHFEILRKERVNHIKNGLIYAISGIILMILGTLVSMFMDEKTFFEHFLVILLEPGGWFLFWEGMYLSVFDSRYKTPDYEFYKKMIKSKVLFI